MEEGRWKRKQEEDYTELATILAIISRLGFVRILAEKRLKEGLEKRQDSSYLNCIGRFFSYTRFKLEKDKQLFKE